MKILYIHIGTHKTGTTSIQCFLNNNRNKLKRLGFSYPNLAKGNAINAYYFARRSVVSFDSKKKDIVVLDKNMINDGLDKIKSEFKQVDNIILSNENLWEHARPEWEDFWRMLKERADRDGYAIKIIVYLRRQDLYAESMYLQFGFSQIKWFDSWEEMLEHDNLWGAGVFNDDYGNALSVLGGVYGDENIIVRRYAKENLVDRDSVRDLLTVLGIERDKWRELEFLQNRSNLSVSFDGVYLWSYFRDNVALAPYRLKSVRQYIKKNFPRIDKSETIWDNKERQKYLNGFRDGNEYIFRIFVKDREGKLFGYEPPLDCVLWTVNSESLVRTWEKFSKGYIESELGKNSLKERFKGVMYNNETFRRFYYQKR